MGTNRFYLFSYWVASMGTLLLGVLCMPHWREKDPPFEFALFLVSFFLWVFVRDVYKHDIKFVGHKT